MRNGQVIIDYELGIRKVMKKAPGPEACQLCTNRVLYIMLFLCLMMLSAALQVEQCSA